MKIYRIEGKEGNGPHNSCIIWMLPSSYNDHVNKLPTPRDEGITLHLDYYCGVLTIDGIKEWFGPFLRELEDAGMELCEYECDEINVKIGKKQVVFCKKESICIKRGKLTSILS